MTKLAIMSDLHIDLNNFGHFESETLVNTLKNEKIDHLHIAGDISNHFHKVSYPFLDDMARHCEVSSNLGNHDMLDLPEKEIENLDFQII